MSVSRNAVYNVIGTALPSVLTLVTVPLYLDAIGVERFGFLTLCWVILGYSGFLEWGLGSAIAQKIAGAGKNHSDSPSDVFWNGLWISLAIGAVGALLIFAGASLYFNTVASGGGFDAELVAAVPWLAATAPILMLSGVLTGAFQGRERFLAHNFITSLAYTLVALLPLLVAYFWSVSLLALVLASLVARLIPFPIGYWLAARIVPVRRPVRPSGRIMKDLLGFGGWVALTQVANGVLATIDRLTIGARIGAAAVPAYAIPFGLVSRIVLIPHSLAGALFPRFAYVDADERGRLVRTAIAAVVTIVTPLTIGLIAVAEPFFRLWIGAELAVVSSPIAYILMGGFWVYCIGHIPFSMIQAAGRPATVAKLLLAEILPYAAALFVGLALFGLPGAAAAFALRLGAEAAALLYLSRTPLAALKPAVLPGLLVASAMLAQWLVPGTARHVIVALLLVASSIWSLFHIPDVLRPMLGPIARLLPRRGGG